MAVSLGAGSVVANGAQGVSVKSLLNITAGSNPAYLVVSLLDRNEYTAASNGNLGTLSGNGYTTGFTFRGGDNYTTGIVFTYNAATGQYTSATYGSLNNLVYTTSTNNDDNVSLSFFTTDYSSLADQYANDPYTLEYYSPSYATYVGSVAVVTQPGVAAQAQATPQSIEAAAMSFVGQAWNMDGCWVLASNISAKAGASLPITSTSLGIPGVNSGEWIVAYNGPAGQTGNWQSQVTAGEMVVFETSSTSGHITTVVSGSGSSAMLVDNITYVYQNGQIDNAANDGSANDIIISAPHSASQEFNQAVAGSVVVYELDCPVINVATSSSSVAAGNKLALDSLFTATNPLASQVITEYQFYDSGTGGAAGDSFLLGSTDYVDHSAANALTINAASLSALDVLAGGSAGTDTVDIRAFNGAYWGDWESLTINVTPPVNTPKVTVSNLAIRHGQSVAGSSLFTYSDPLGKPAAQYDVWDTGSGGGHFLLNGAALAVGQDNIIAASRLSQLSYQSGSGADTLWVRANDGTAWGAWSSAFTVTAPVDNPTATVSNLVVSHGQSLAGSSLFTYSDALGSAATQYDVWDTGTGGGHFLLNGVTLGTNQNNIINAAQLSQLTYQSGSGADPLWVRANDGTVWGAWSSAFTVTAPVDSGPTEIVSNLAASHGQSFAGSSLFTYSDPLGSAATQYDVWDRGTGGGHFLLNGVALGINQNNIIDAAQLSQLTYQSGSGADTLWVRASDGTVWGAWSSAFTVTAPVDSGPTETVSNIAASHGQSFAGSGLFTYSDPLGSDAVEYNVWDRGTGGGHFLLNGVALGINQNNIIDAAQLSQLTYQSGSGADTLWVRASDGTVWGAWSSAFTATAPIDAGPIETPVNSAMNSVAGQSFSASGLFSYSDPFGSAATEYDVWDTGSGGGRFVLNGAALGINQDNIITATQLSQLTYEFGSGTDTLWIRASDGTVWGAWSKSISAVNLLTLGTGQTVELTSPAATSMTFSGPGETLKLDDSASFSGTVAGMGSQDSIDFADISFAGVQTPSYAGTASKGTLTVTDGTHTANIALLGNYLASSFVASSDGHGGTLVADVPQSQSSVLAQSQHA